jgi:hypothetical protein
VGNTLVLTQVGEAVLAAGGVGRLDGEMISKSLANMVA